MRDGDYLILRLGGLRLRFLQVGHIPRSSVRQTRRVAERVQKRLLQLANYTVLTTPKMGVRVLSNDRVIILGPEGRE